MTVALWIFGVLSLLFAFTAWGVYPKGHSDGDMAACFLAYSCGLVAIVGISVWVILALIHWCK